MIFLTGDVHHVDRRMSDQLRAHGATEAGLCRPYLEIANSHGIFPTLFFTGLVIKRERETIFSLLQDYNFEIGGHTYSANRQRMLLALSRRLLRLANGPAWFQKRDMEMTLAVIHRQLGITPVSWRNHGYRMDRNTYRIACELGVRQVSNVVSGFEARARLVDGVLEVPINTLADHESLGHDHHPRRCATAEDWVDRVLEQTAFQQARGLPSVILAHPLCMYIEDYFRAFERLCKSLSRWPSAPMRDAASSVNRANRH